MNRFWNAIHNGLKKQKQFGLSKTSFACHKRNLKQKKNNSFLLLKNIFKWDKYEKVYFVQLGPIFVGSVLFQFKKYQNFILNMKLLGKNLPNPQSILPELPSHPIREKWV